MGVRPPRQRPGFFLRPREGTDQRAQPGVVKAQQHLVTDCLQEICLIRFPLVRRGAARHEHACRRLRDRKSTRLNSSHLVISYAVFCLKKKKKKQKTKNKQKKNIDSTIMTNDQQRT